MVFLNEPFNCDSISLMNLFGSGILRTLTDIDLDLMPDEILRKIVI